MEQKSYYLFIKNNFYFLLFGFISIFFGNIGQSFFISWFGADIQTSLNISASDYGFYYATATLCSGSLLMFIGSKADEINLQHLSKIITIGLLFACLIMWQANNSFLLFLGLFLLRLCGQGLLPHIAQTSMARYFGKDRGKALSIVSCGIPVGEALLPIVIVGLLGWVGWQSTWLYIGIIITLIYIPLSHALLNHTQLESDKENSVSALKMKGRKDVLADPAFYLVIPTALIGPFFVTGFFIQQNFVVEAQSWTASLLASSFILYGLTHWLGSMLSGSMVDKVSATKLIPLVNIPLLIALLLLCSSHGSWQVFPTMGLIGFAMGITGPVINSFWAEAYGLTHFGAIRAMVVSFAILSTAAAPWVFGISIDSGMSSHYLFKVCSIALFVFIILAGIGSKIYSQRGRQDLAMDSL